MHPASASAPCSTATDSVFLVLFDLSLLQTPIPPNRGWRKTRLSKSTLVSNTEIVSGHPHRRRRRRRRRFPYLSSSSASSTCLAPRCRIRSRIRIYAYIADICRTHTGKTEATQNTHEKTKKTKHMLKKSLHNKCTRLPRSTLRKIGSVLCTNSSM